MPCEDEDRNWDDTVEAKECQRLPENHKPEARREAWNKFSRIALKRNQPCRHLDLRLLSTRTVRQ